MSPSIYAVPTVGTDATDRSLRWSGGPRELQKRPGLGAPNDFLRLGANESPYGPIPEVAERMAQACLTVNRYPDVTATSLRQALAHQFGVRAAQILIGNGSSELIHVLSSAFGGAGSEVVVSVPSFPLYAASVSYTEAKLVQVSVLEDGSTDVVGLLSAIGEQTSLLYLCNPNNPTGAYLGRSQIEAFLRSVPAHVVVVLDEAYWELTDAFCEGAEDSVSLCETFANLVILRTFSKFYGLAGLRVGYMIGGNEGMMARLAGVRPMVMPNTIGIVGALSCVEHYDAYLLRAKGMAVERARVIGTVRALGYDVWDTQTNFYCMPFAAGDEPFAKAGIHVRGGDTIQMPGHIRISLGTPEENDQAIDVLRSCK